MPSTQKQKIYLVACCYNEGKLLPFFLDYYANFIGVSKFFLFDGGSTDDTPEIIKDYPVELIVHKSDKLDDRQLMYFRNEGYKTWRNECDWFIVCDIDEFLFHPDIHTALAGYKSQGITLPLVEGFEMLSKQFPVFKKGDYMPNFIQTGTPNPAYYNKHLIFDPIIDINYTLGCHQAQPTGPVKKNEQFEFKNLHYKILSYDYFLSKAKAARDRISDWNKEVGAGFHYAEFAKKTETEFLSFFSAADNVFAPVNPQIDAHPLANFIATHLLRDTDEFRLLDLSNNGRYASSLEPVFQPLEKKFGARRVRIDHTPSVIDAEAVRAVMSLSKRCNTAYIDVSMLKVEGLSFKESLTLLLSVLASQSAGRSLLALLDLAFSSAQVQSELLECEFLKNRFQLAKFENLVLATLNP